MLKYTVGTKVVVPGANANPRYYMYLQFVKSARKPTNFRRCQLVTVTVCHLRTFCLYGPLVLNVRINHLNSNWFILFVKNNMPQRHRELKILNLLIHDELYLPIEVQDRTKIWIYHEFVSWIPLFHI